ncbi:hypothetical protein CYMTET_11554 [Cymbomonas tetramitiformis]|uniref:Cyclic nucleotide-binding domain-containing protein n=1 Tax=Cymbomonas tetramitiformis TaxID=36881 RepID=A0AAE0GMG2_9CHLO|nr:hypothetical protein CYMTET_11554 [Cymbomonas tetramitiformis]
MREGQKLPLSRNWNSLSGFTGSIHLFLSKWRKVLSCISNIRLHLTYTFSLFFYIVHSVACLWWLHSRLEDFPQGDSDSSDPWGPTDEVVDSSFSTQYLSSLLWAVKAFAGVITNEATTDSEKAVSIVVIIIGLIVLSYLIGEVCSCFVQSRIRELRYRQRMDTADDVLRQHECDDKLRARVHNYYSSMWQRRMTKDIKLIFSDLPPHVQHEIHYTLKFDFIKKVPFFRDLSDQMLSLVAARLDPCFAIKGDLIIKTGEVGMEMYFIIKGAVEVLSPGVGNVPEKVYATLTVGCYFGEKSIIRQESRNAHVRAKEDTEMMVLQKSDLDHVLEMNPEWKQALESSIRSRLWQSAGTRAGVSAPESALAASFRKISQHAKDLREAESTRHSISPRHIAREGIKEEDDEKVIEKVDERSDSKENDQFGIDEHSQP